jgi:ATP-dependent DNA helicase RecG
MTATPIPRTLALTLYGDLDLTVLDEMPPGRKRVITEVVGKSDRDQMYDKVRTELDAGRQAYVICPRIDDPDPRKVAAVQAKSVRSEAARLRMKELKGYRVGILHGQMKPSEKEEAMRKMLRHELDVLVATSVIEVGVNVPNATVIIIEGAERFGLAQLHQLRGRVVRSTHQSYCFVLTSEGGTTTRLKALATAKNGFELAELDLKIRGPGELYGRSQSGLTDLGMEALKNLKMVEAARKEAMTLVSKDTALKKHPHLAQVVLERNNKLHFE